MHLIVDGYKGNLTIMQSQGLIYDLLNDLPEIIGMTKISEPEILNYDAINQEHSGISGFVLIAESHISIHTFPWKNYVNIDIFSCKEFEAKITLDLLKNKFEFEEVNHWILDRGLEWIDKTMGQKVTKQQRIELSER